MKHLCYMICLLGMLVYGGSSLKVRYDGDQVLKITPQTTDQVRYLQALSKEWQLDLWKPDSAEEIHEGRETHIQIPFSRIQLMKENLLGQGIPFTIMISDVQKLIDKNAQSGKTMQRNQISSRNYNYTIYHPMDEIYQWMEDIETNHGDLVTKHYLGSTYENHSIYYLKLGLPSNKKKKAFFMECGIHAREWISVAYCQWFVKEIISNYKDDFNLTKVLKQVDFYVIPVLNVDGYIYSWTTDRLWRKNRSVQENGTCYGVDLNRNFDSHWCSTGADSVCESFIYCGPSPASEMETQALVALVEEHKTEILCYLNIHSYGQLILYAYGYTYNISENNDELASIAKIAVEKIMERYNSYYIQGRASATLYTLSGSSSDWVTDLKINLSYTFELRDEGDYGFELPPDQIEPTCEETMDALMGIIDYINENYLEDNAVSITSVWMTILLSCALHISYSIFN
ncbi:carboxypeptidase O-like [Pelobates fuscus]|uniref:carboxypeptidase O-like n=1 Tax=Pelobates fuscus TaxID=191477 RepID=UPI002FE460CB